MNNITWDDIKNIAKEIHISKERWKNSNLVLFGARMNGSFAYERIKTQYKIYAFSDNDSSLGG